MTYFKLHIYKPDNIVGKAKDALFSLSQFEHYFQIQHYNIRAACPSHS